MEQGTNFSKMLPSYYRRLIKDIDERVDDWNSETIRKIFKERYEYVFWNEVSKRDMRKFTKEWHKSIKKLTRYDNKTGILNLQHGPVANRQDWQAAKQ